MTGPGQRTSGKVGAQDQVSGASHLSPRDNTAHWQASSGGMEKRELETGSGLKMQVLLGTEL